MPRFKLTFLFFVFIAFLSCQYELHEENICELLESSNNENFNLALLPEHDTLIIFDNQNITFNFETDNLGILKVVFTLQDKSWQFDTESGIFEIIPGILDAGYCYLNVEIYTHSGTGSIADNMNIEPLITNKKWFVLIDGREPPEITPTKEITPEGFVKFTWPKCDQYNFVSYELEGRIGDNMISEVINDPDLTYYTDSNFVTGMIRFKVGCNTYSDFTDGFQYSEDQYASELYMYEIGIDSIRFYWEKSEYNAKYKLSWNSTELIFDSREDTFCTVPNPGFAMTTKYRLTTGLASSEIWPTDENDYTIDQFSYFLGYLASYSEEAEYTYNSLDKVVYTNSNYNVSYYNVNTGLFDKKAYIADIIFGGLLSCPTNSTKLSVFVNGYIYMFEGVALPNYYYFKVEDYNWMYPLDYFFMTNDNSIAYAANGKYKLIDIATQQVVDSLTITDYPAENKSACFATSQDAKRVCIVSQNGLKIYNITDAGIVEYYSDSRSYRSAYFDPFDPDKLMLTLFDHTNIEIRNASDFSLIKTIELPSDAIIQNIDPESGYLLLNDYEQLFVVDTETGEIVFKINCNDPKPKLYANILFSQSGYYLDITEKLQ